MTRGLLVTGRDATEMLDSVEETFDEVALLKELFVIRNRLLSTGL